MQTKHMKLSAIIVVILITVLFLTIPASAEESGTGKTVATTTGESGIAQGRPVIQPRSSIDFTFTNHTHPSPSTFSPGLINDNHIFDLTTSISFDKHISEGGSNPYDKELSYGYPDTKGAGVEIGYIQGEILIFTDLSEGRYYSVFTAKAYIDPDEPGIGTRADTATVLLNIVKIGAKPSADSLYKNADNEPVNPNSLELTHTGAAVPGTLAKTGTAVTYEWQIVKTVGSAPLFSGKAFFDKDGKFISGEQPNDVDNEIVKGLAEGEYILQQKTIATTVYGNFTANDGKTFAKGTTNFNTVDWVDAPFVIVNPEPETIIEGIINPTAINPVTSPTKVEVKSKHPLNTNINNDIDDEKQASDATWQLFKKSSTGVWIAIDDNPTSFENGKTDADIEFPTEFGDYKVIVSETIAGRTATAEGYFRFPSSHIEVEYWIENASGDLVSVMDYPGIPAVTWPSRTESTPDDTYNTTGMSIPHGYELIKVEEVVDSVITTPSIPTVNSYTATYPAHGKTTVVKYIYREIAKTTVEVKHVYEDGTAVPNSNIPSVTGYPSDAHSTSKLSGEILVKVKEDVNGTDTPNLPVGDRDTKFPLTGTTVVTYVYKNPILPQSSTTVTGTKVPSGAIYNPTSITGGQKIPSSALTWEIKDGNGKVVKTGSGTTVPKADIDALVDGSYTVSFIETAVDSKTSVTNGTFVMVTPNPKPVIDKQTNPESITATPQIPESTLSWELFDKNDKLISSGKGGTVPKSEIDKLPAGDYKVVFTETSPVPGLSAKNPITFTKTGNPTTGTGSGSGSWTDTTVDHTNAWKTADSSKTTTTTTTTTNKESTNPQTGDDTDLYGQITLLVIVGSISFMVFLFSVLNSKKQKSKKKEFRQMSLKDKNNL